MECFQLDAQTLGLPVDTAIHLGGKYKLFADSLSENDAGAICDHSKNLLESVLRTIITNRNGSVDETPDRHATLIDLYGQAWNTFLHNDTDEYFKPIIHKGVEAIGIVRNNYGASSHGQDGYDERSIKIEEAIYIARITLTIVGYLYSRHKNTSGDFKNKRLNYDDNPNFNEYIDIDGDIEIAGIFVTPSRILFDNDPIAYKEKLLEYINDMYIDEIESAKNSWLN